MSPRAPASRTPPTPHPALGRAERATLRLLGPLADDPTPRARRIAGIYAACYLEEPFLGSWFGLASYAARQVYDALEGPALGWRDMMGQGNLGIYSGMVSAWLVTRAGHPPGALGAGRRGLSEAYSTFERADAMLGQRDGVGSTAEAEALAELGLAQLCAFEQTELLQPACDSLGVRWRDPLRRVFGFRLGLAPSAEVLAWDDQYGAPWVAADRCAWMTARVLPAWAAVRKADPDLVRAEVDRTRRWGRVTLAELAEALEYVRGGEPREAG